MSSANGIVPAGHVYFTLTDTMHNDMVGLTMTLQRCQDYNAKILLQIGYQSSQAEVSLVTSEREINGESQENHLRLEDRNGGSIEKLRILNRQCYSATRLGSYDLGRQNYNKRSNRSKKRDTPIRNITENDEPINAVSNQQLIKEHQDYWLQIVRLEAANEALQGKVGEVEKESESLQEENESMRFELLKMHALIGEVQESGATIQSLESEMFESKKLLMKRQEQLREVKRQL